MANDNKELTENTAGFDGFRFLVDATGDRQYAVKFKAGKPVQPVHVFSDGSKDKKFTPNEKVYAFEEGAVVGATPSGDFKVSAMAYQITTNTEGKPNNVKTAQVEYDATFTPQAETPVVFTLTAASTIALQQTGFSKDFPEKITGMLESTTDSAAQTPSGLFLPSSEISMGLTFPPQHPKGAELAHEGIKNIPAAEGSIVPFLLVDKDTLAETKELGGGERLKIIFNFEAARVNEVYTVPGQQPAITGHHFDEHDPDALKIAFDKLVDLGGAPKLLASMTAPKFPRPAAKG